MSSPTLNHRVMEFASKFPPFNFVERVFFEEITQKAIVRFYKKNEYLTEDLTFLKEYLLIVKEGLIHAFTPDDAQAHAWHSEGDLPNLDFLLEETPNHSHLQAIEDTLVYAFPFSSKMEDWLTQSGVALFFGNGFSRESAVKKLFLNDESPATTAETIPQNAFHLFRIKDLLPKEKRKWVAGEASWSVAQAAQAMTDAQSSALVVLDAAQCPIGILTDSDLRKKVATGLFDVGKKVSEVMSSPVVTLSPETTFSDAQLTMMHHNMHHLCITANGTPKSAFEGVVTKEDLVQLSTNHPIHLLNRILKTEDIAELAELRNHADQALKEYFQLDVATHFIAGIITEINDALIKQIIRIALTEIPDFPTHIPFVWLSLGSEGREEQLLRTDQDNALLFADEGEAHRAAFLTLGQKVCAYLTQAGFEQCPAEIMASNPAWNASLSTWRGYYQKWIASPTPLELMHSTIFFDARAIYGDVSLLETIHQTAFQEMERHKLFIHHLAANALQNPPPLGFFRNIIMEKEGEHKDRFDLKARALMPLTDIARTLIYSKRGELPQNTLQRFEWLSEQEPQNRILFQEAKEAVAWLLKIRTLSGLAHRDSGRYIALESLSRWQRRNLRQTFKLIGDLQQLVRTRFRLDYLRN